MPALAATCEKGYRNVEVRIGISRLRCISRKIARIVLGEDILVRSGTLQRMLAYSVNGEQISDSNLIVPLEYERNSVIGTRLFYNGEFEENEIAFVTDLLQHSRNPTVLDIGANIGWHAICWAVACSGARVYAFEPSTKTAVLLKTNAALNGVEAQIKCVPCAVSDQEGVADFHECEDSGYSSLKDTKRKKVISKVSVPVITIDRFVEEEGITQLAVIKIDVEGLETEVLRGALRTLETMSPDVVVEIYRGKASNPNPEETIRLMQSVGYKAFHWKNGNIVPHSIHSDKYFNYYFTKR
ncbi:MAG: FkbM family methyltransferase [Nitrososphaerales archaeon]